MYKNATGITTAVAATNRHIRRLMALSGFNVFVDSVLGDCISDNVQPEE